jgi:alkylation response protein AidB-like acyl-CoA dehydrogenase
MRFALTSEQQLLRREARDGVHSWSADDVAGLGLVEQAIVLEEAGRAGIGERFETVARGVQERLVAVAAESVGIAQRALDLAVAHAATRRQFGKAIGTYQAVAHPLADTYVEAELARSLSYWAAWCVAEGEPEAEVASAAAKSLASEAAVAACERSIQVHGGVGFTWEHELRIHYTRALALEAAGGYPARQRAMVARRLLDEEAAWTD